MEAVSVIVSVNEPYKLFSIKVKGIVILRNCKLGPVGLAYLDINLLLISNE